MANYNFVQANNMQLYDDLKRIFPEATHAMLAETIQKHGYHRERCIEELLINCCSSRNYDYASHNHNQSYQQDRTFEHPAGVGQRSQSVSEVPGRDGGGGDAFGPRNANQNFPQCPQSAPVPGAGVSSRGAVRFSYNNNNNPSASPWNPPGRVMDPPPSYTSTVTIRPPRPPVPPPTYLTHTPRAHFPQQPPGSPRPLHQPPGSPRPQHYPTPGAAPALGGGSQSVRAKTSLNIVPSLPHIPGTYESRYDSEVWGPPPPYGWVPDAPASASASSSTGPGETHSSSVSLKLGGAGGHGPQPHLQMASSGGMVNYGGSSSAGVPYHSQLQISIGPTGGAITATRTQQRLHPSTPPTLLFGAQSRGNGAAVGSSGFSSPPAYGPPSMSPRQYPAAAGRSAAATAEEEAQQRSLFDENDPEQERIGQAPLKPVRSPQPGAAAGGRPGDPMAWLAGARVPHDEDAYARALILHQHKQFHILRDELQKETWHLDEIQKTVDSQERQYFHKHFKYPDQIFFTFEDIQKLRAEVRSLMIDCECMTRVVDVLHKGQVPLGETNEDFYRVIHTGQEGRVLPESGDDDLVGGGAGGGRRRIWPLHRPNPDLLLLPTQSSPPSLPSAGVVGRHTPSVSPIPPGAAAAAPPTNAGGGRSPLAAGGVKEEVADDDEGDGPRWECCACTFLNSPAMLMCEICEMPKFGQATPGEETHNFRIHVKQDSTCAAASKALQLKLTHRLGVVKR